MILRVLEGQAPSVLNGLFRRELVVNPPATPPRWLMAHTVGGPVRALGFVIDRHSPFYAGRLPLEEVVDVLSKAAWHWGSCVEYLQNTVAHLEELGIRDRNLWRLQALVAERIHAATSSPESNTTSPVP